MPKEVSKRTLLKFRGHMALKEQLIKAGGMISLQDAAEILGVTSTIVRKLVEQKSILAVSLGGYLQFPVWQFSETGIVEGFSNILSNLKNTTEISAVQFFLMYDEDLKMSPIEALTSGNNSKIDLVHLLAQQWQQQTAR